MKAKYKTTHSTPVAKVNIEFLVSAYELRWATINLLWLNDYDESKVTKKGIIKEVRHQLYSRGDDFTILISESNLGSSEMNISMGDLEETAEKIIKKLFPDFFKDH
mgnify:CR=1 FL=1